METQTDENKTYSTRDLNLAATLVTLRFFPLPIDYQIEGSKPVGYFNFNDSEELQAKLQEYWRDEILVEPKQFMNNVRSLKAQVTNIYKGPRVNIDKLQQR